MRIMDYVWPRWEFLGHTDISYTDAKQPDYKDQCTLYFYACGERRRVARARSWGKRKAQRHPFWQSRVAPWLQGENLYSPIVKPSVRLIDKARDEHGYAYVDGRWVPPQAKPARDGNVIRFVKSGPPPDVA